MPCNICITGFDFNVDEYLSKTDWKQQKVDVRHKGDPIGFTGKMGSFKDAGFFIFFSDAPFENFEKQQQDAIEFLKEFYSNLKLLSEYNIDGLHSLDFGLSTYPANRLTKTYTLNPELLRLAGEFNLEIEMCNWFTNDNYRLRRPKKRWPLKAKIKY